LVDNNENDDEDEEILADIEACKQSAKAILSSATTVMEQWSTTGSEFGLELGVAKREELEQWVEKLHISNSSSSYPKSDSTVEDTVSVTSNSTGPVITRDEREPRPSRKDWTKEELGVREDLIREGIVEFYKGDYSDANGCFQRAYDLGFIQRSRRNPTSDTGRTGDEALKLCTCLATLRWSNAEQLPLSELLRQKSLEMLGLDGRRDYIRTNDPKLNWLYANIYLELGELQKAESRCQFAFEHYPRNQRLPPKNDGVYVPGDYDDVILTMVAILYTKHLAALAKFWKAKVSARSLQAKGAQFFVMRGESKPPSELSISTAIKQQNFTAALWLDQYPSSHSTLDLREAIKVKSFPLISMIVDHCEASKPGDSQIDTVLHEAVEQDNLPAVEFLLEAGLDIDSLCLLVTDRFPSRSTYPQKFSLRTDQVCTPLGRAIYHGQLAVSEILLQKGASLALRNESVLYLAIHSPSWQNTIPLLLRYGTNVNVLFPLLPEVTTLSYAVQRSEGLYCGDGDDDTLVRMLVEAGADLNKPSTLTESMDFNSFNYTNKPLTPLEMARILKLHNVEKCLLEAGAKDNDALDLYSLPVKPASKGASLSHNISPVPTDERSELKLQKRKGFRAMFGRSKNN
jgi:tetratricopeptide (TPR) repeat protein